MGGGNVLIVEDENDVCQLLKRVVALEGFTVSVAANIKSAAKILQQESIDVVLCDVKLPDGNGIEFNQQIRAIKPGIEFILLTAYGNIPDSVQAIKGGAFDYITKGNDNDRILPLVYRAMEKVRLEKKVAELERKISSRYANFDSIIGNSDMILKAKELAKMAAPSGAPVLLLGETGTGKEVFAQAIHSGSSRAKHAFIALNCSAFSKELLESELFGYKSGAFTGAVRDKKGLIEEANEGTLFLDELGETPLDFQVKLLRVLETSEFIKVGDTKPTKVNLRIIAATNRNLVEEVAAGKFREDLFYRLNTFMIYLPPLRDRQEDIPIFAESFLKQFTRNSYRHVSGMSQGFIDYLKRNDWHGNIRELKNVIERALIVCHGDTLTKDHLPVEFQYTTLKSKTLSAFDLASVESFHIQRVLQYTEGNKTQAAKLLKIGVATLYRKIEEYKITL
jgi:two-component system NtrC family response regulator